MLTLELKPWPAAAAGRRVDERAVGGAAAADWRGHGEQPARARERRRWCVGGARRAAHSPVGWARPPSWCSCCGRGVTARGGWAEHVLGGEDASQEVAPFQRRLRARELRRRLVGGVWRAPAPPVGWARPLQSGTAPAPPHLRARMGGVLGCRASGALTRAADLVNVFNCAGGELIILKSFTDEC